MWVHEFFSPFRFANFGVNNSLSLWINAIQTSLITGRSEFMLAGGTVHLLLYLYYAEILSKAIDDPDCSTTFHRSVQHSTNSIRQNENIFARTCDRWKWKTNTHRCCAVRFFGKWRAHGRLINSRWPTR